jgi:hypothetical protein
MFKGFVRTDFRQLKGEEKQNIKKKSLIDKGLYLEKADIIQEAKTQNDPDAKKRRLLDYEMGHSSLKINDMLRYGIYRLYENGKFLGTVELVPCYKGENCRKKSKDKSITKVKVYNHELTFYQDILDLVRMNQKMYGKTSYDDKTEDGSNPDETMVDDTMEYSENAFDLQTPEKPETIHVGRGCSAKKAIK